MKITPARNLLVHNGLVLKKGETAKVSEEVGKSLIAGGAAVEVKTKTKAKPTES